MRTHPISSFLFSAALALAGLVAHANAKATEPPAAPASAPDPRSVLDKGMSAEDIVKLVGKPLTIVDLKTDELKAEKWTYRRLVERTVLQEPTTVVSEPAFIGVVSFANHMMGTRQTTQYSLMHVAIYQVTTLLMINDHLVRARQWNEQQVSYE